MYEAELNKSLNVNPYAPNSFVDFRFEIISMGDQSGWSSSKNESVNKTDDYPAVTG